MPSQLQEEIARKIAPFKEHEVLVQYLSDLGGWGIREGILNPYFRNDTDYLCISVQEPGALHPPILVGKTSVDSQLVRVVSETQKIIFEDEILLPRWKKSYLGFVLTFPYSTGKDKVEKLFAKYGLDLPEK